MMSLTLSIAASRILLTAMKSPLNQLLIISSQSGLQASDAMRTMKTSKTAENLSELSDYSPMMNHARN